MKENEDKGFIEPQNLISCNVTAFFTTRSAGDNVGVIAERYNFSKEALAKVIKRGIINKANQLSIC